MPTPLTVRCVPPPAPGNIGDVTALISCINTANAEGGGTIDLGGLTYTLLSADNTVEGANGLPDITSNIIIKNGMITKDPTLQFRFLHVSNLGSLSLKKVILTNGNASLFGGGAILVAVDGVLGTVEDSEFSNNQASVSDRIGFALGGALRVDGEFFEIRRTVFSNNQTVAAGSATDSLGGAIYMGVSAVGGTISESIFTANTANETNRFAVTVGGAIFLDGAASINTNIHSSFIANNSPGAEFAFWRALYTSILALA